MRRLRSDRQGPARASSLLVFLHGYGANGADLMPLAGALAAELPGTAFLAPDAPEACAMNPGGLQWFPIPWLDGSSEAEARAGIEAAADDLGRFLAGALAAEGLAPSRLALLGFSQGAMLALHLAPRLPEPLAAVVGISGRLVMPERLAAETRARPPVLLIHGDADEVVPFASLSEAGRALDAAGFDVSAHVMRGTGHGIAPDGLEAAAAFLKPRLAAV